MEYFFFHSIDNTYSSAFKQLSTRHNVTNGKILSLSILGLCLLTFILSLLFDFKAIYGDTYYNYLVAFDFFVGTSLLYYISIDVIRRLRLKKRYIYYKIISDSYAICIVAGSMWQSFVMQHNPANTMTMFLIGTLCVGILWLFSARMSIAFSIIALVLFILWLPYFQVDHHKLFSNILMAVCIVTVFFCVSRLVYSYHYNYFAQLKTVEKKNIEISRMDRNKTEILGIVAHDLRSPINNITALVNLSKESASSEELEEYYNMILQSCKETDNIIHDLIEVAKGSEEELVTKEVEIVDFLNNIKQQWIYRTGGDRIIEVVNADHQYFAHIHPQKMQRVLDNLINNAVKFTYDGGVIMLDVKKEADKLHLSVTDNGIGIPAELHPYLFERFSKAGRSGLNGEKSHGLGLNICKQIIEQHNGSIYLVSRENIGTAFTIELPV